MDKSWKYNFIKVIAEHDATLDASYLMYKDILNGSIFLYGLKHI